MVTQPGHRSAAAIVVASLALIAFMTLRPAPVFTTLPAGCIFCGPLGGVDFALNLVLFVPLGLGLRWAIGDWRTSTLVGAITTGVVEFLQWRFIPGRDASAGDLLSNTLGTMLGAWLAIEVIRWLNATPSLARRLAAVFAFVAVTVVAASAWLLQPIPTKYPQWSQWKPPRPNLDLFQGRLFSVDVNGTAIHPTEILRPPRTLDLATGSLTVTATVAGHLAPTRRQAIIVRIANEREEGFALAQWRDAVVFRSHIAAARLKLRPLVSRLDRAFSEGGTDGEGMEFTILANSNPRAMVLGKQGAPAATLPRSVGLAWALFLPWDVAINSNWWPANAGWLGLIVLPIGFFTMRSRRRVPDEPGIAMTWWPVALMIVAMVAAPALSGLSSLGVGEWIGVALGLVVGAAIEAWVASRGIAGLNAR
jgi:VanZ like protein